MPERPVTEAEAIARFSRELDEIVARGRAPDCADRIAEIILENERGCGAMRELRLGRTKDRSANR